MNAFEALVAMLLRHEGYWVTPSYKVNLTKKERKAVGLPTAPRWEVDVIAYKGSTNELLAVECKSFLYSKGVTFRGGKFYKASTYKLFNKPDLRKVVLRRLKRQLVNTGACQTKPKVTLCLAAGKIASVTDRPAMDLHFKKNRWRLFDADWIRERLKLAANSGYENDLAFVVSKLLEVNRGTTSDLQGRCLNS